MTYPMHPTKLPDFVAVKMSEVAREHGYFVEELTLGWCTVDAVSTPTTVRVRYAPEQLDTPTD